jgi:hypothetical protein
VIWFDSYERHARLAPGLLALMPVSVAVLALGLQAIPVISTLGGLLVATGGPIILVNTVRTRGRRLQDVLYKRWGGAPTTQLLRTEGVHATAVERRRWRASLSSLSGVTLPSTDDPRREPGDADSKYEMMVSVAIERTRDHRLVSEENKSYGFHRNLLGMRTIGIAASAASSVAVLVALLAGGFAVPMAAGALVNAVVLAMWLTWPTQERVKDAGFRYARQLLNAASPERL